MEVNFKNQILGQLDKLDKPDIWNHAEFNSTDCGEDNEDKDETKGPKKDKEEEEYDEEYYYDVIIVR